MTHKQIEILSSDALNKEISAIGKVGAKLNLRIQIAAINAIWYSVQHGDIGFGQRLVLAMNAGQRKNSLVAFLEKHGKFQWNKEEKNLIYRKRDDLNADAVLEITEFWHDAIKESDIKSMFDFDEEANRFLKKLEKQLKTPNATIKGSSLYDYMAEAYAKYHADQLEVDEEIEEESEEFSASALRELKALIAEGANEERQPMRMAA